MQPDALRGLALFALAIGGTTLYAMAAFTTAQRTNEVGLRKSQGASSTAILRLLVPILRRVDVDGLAVQNQTPVLSRNRTAQAYPRKNGDDERKCLSAHTEL